VLQQARPGSIVLLHDGGGDRSATVEALPRIIDGLKRRRLAFVTL
jgi:peptidoglycan/xylan/chitin deacetylase (PgdA/CDA1 family)